MKVEGRGTRMAPLVGIPTIALSAHWHTYPDRFHWIAEHGFALEYSPNPGALDLLPVHLGLVLEAGISVRHHAFFPQFELGHSDEDVAENALRVHLAAVDAMRGHGEQVVTIHVGLDPQVELDAGRVVANLARLVDHAQRLGVTVALENLRYGPTSNPETVVAWARRAGSMITLDVGHAVSCERAKAGNLDPLDWVAMFGERLVEAHVYEREASRHYPPRDMSVLGPIVDGLLTTGCRWWTIELNDLDEALATRTLLLDYIGGKRAQAR